MVQNGGMTKNVEYRMCNYALMAQSAGADIILNQCSSAGEMVYTARKMLRIPILRIDEPAAQKAVKAGKNITIITTVQTTLESSRRLIEAEAKRQNKEVRIEVCFIEEAFKALTERNDENAHNRLIINEIEKRKHQSDAVLLAQGSMISLEPYIKNYQIPIIATPLLAIKK